MGTHMWRQRSTRTLSENFAPSRKFRQSEDLFLNFCGTPEVTTPIFFSHSGNTDATKFCTCAQNSYVFGLYQSPAPLPTWVTGIWHIHQGMCTYEQTGHTMYQVMSNTWYRVYPVPGKSGDQVPGVTGYWEGGTCQEWLLGTRGIW